MLPKSTLNAKICTLFVSFMCNYLIVNTNYFLYWGGVKSRGSELIKKALVWQDKGFLITITSVGLAIDEQLMDFPPEKLHGATARQICLSTKNT